MAIACVRDRSPIEILLSVITKRKSNWDTAPVRRDSLQGGQVSEASLSTLSEQTVLLTVGIEDLEYAARSEASTV